mmetsp:Transcript_44065/g.86994  ORF Transcript_44065/g.86994 Transcript_44065/m.86994 type:complete len:220 (-) Transcript_44065:43-702(-)
MPCLSASSAMKSRPVSVTSRAHESLAVFFGRRWMPPRSAAMAKSISFRANFASEAQSRTSHASAISRAPPMQAPWIAAMTGFWHLSMDNTESCKKAIIELSLKPFRAVSLSSSSSAPPQISAAYERSRPDEKQVDDPPDRTMQRQEGSSERVSKIRRSSVHAFLSRALRYLGLLKETEYTWRGPDGSTGDGTASTLKDFREERSDMFDIFFSLNFVNTR